MLLFFFSIFAPLLTEPVFSEIYLNLNFISMLLSKGKISAEEIVFLYKDKYFNNCLVVSINLLTNIILDSLKERKTMSFQSLNPELTTKVLLLANLQRSLVRFYY